MVMFKILIIIMMMIKLKIVIVIPILVTLVGIVTDVSDVHEEKAYWRILVTP